MVQGLSSAMVDSVLKYLRTTPYSRMFLHLVWLFCILMMLSTSYIITFHFQPVMQLFRHSHSLAHFSQELSVTIAVDQAVQNEIQSLLVQSNANRAYVFRYHNGIPSVNSIPFMFHTMTHEAIRAGTSRVIAFNQRLPTSIMVNMTVDFSRKRCVVLNNLDRNPDGINHWHYSMRGAVALVRCPFFSEGGDLLGFVGIDFTDRVNDQTLANAERITTTAADKLSIIFQNRSPRH